jgi:hypothetical protein
VQAAYPSLLSELNSDWQILTAEPPKGRPSKVFMEFLSSVPHDHAFFPHQEISTIVFQLELATYTSLQAIV